MKGKKRMSRSSRSKSRRTTTAPINNNLISTDGANTHLSEYGSRCFSER